MDIFRKHKKPVNLVPLNEEAKNRVGDLLRHFNLKLPANDPTRNNLYIVFFPISEVDLYQASIEVSRDALREGKHLLAIVTLGNSKFSYSEKDTLPRSLDPSPGDTVVAKYEEEIYEALKANIEKVIVFSFQTLPTEDHARKLKLLLGL